MAIVRVGHGTTPSLEMKVLRAFVPLPISLAAKCLVTPIESASVRPLMAFLVFPGCC